MKPLVQLKCLLDAAIVLPGFIVDTPPLHCYASPIKNRHSLQKLHTSVTLFSGISIDIVEQFLKLVHKNICGKRQQYYCLKKLLLRLKIAWIIIEKICWKVAISVTIEFSFTSIFQYIMYVALKKISWTVYGSESLLIVGTSFTTPKFGICRRPRFHGTKSAQNPIG